MIEYIAPNLLIYCNLFHPNESYSEVIQRLYKNEHIDVQFWYLRQLQLYIKEYNDMVYQTEGDK